MRMNKWVQFLVLPIVLGVITTGAAMAVLVPMSGRWKNTILIESSSSSALEFANLKNKQIKEVEPPKPEFVNLNTIGLPQRGQTIGKVIIDGTGVDCDLYYGDGNYELNRGAGIYADAHIPGEGSTVLVAGHTGTYFSGFSKAEIGDIVKVNTYYGDYEYKIVDMKVVEATDSTAYDLTKQEENIILYTCYPFGIIQETPYRYFIYGELVSGPEIEK